MALRDIFQEGYYSSCPLDWTMWGCVKRLGMILIFSAFRFWRRANFVLIHFDFHIWYSAARIIAANMAFSGVYRLNSEISSLVRAQCEEGYDIQKRISKVRWRGGCAEWGEKREKHTCTLSLDFGFWLSDAYSTQFAHGRYGEVLQACGGQIVYCYERARVLRAAGYMKNLEGA